MSAAVTPLADIRCPDCHQLLFKAAGPFDVEILCDGIECKRLSRASGSTLSRIKRLTWPNAAAKKRRLADEQENDSRPHFAGGVENR